MDTEKNKWKAGRPNMPPEYGMPASEEGILPWSHVEERMAQAKAYWISTVDPECRPHATPVDGIWTGGKLYFSGDPRTRRQRNLAGNPNACIHLENGYDVIIMHGTARKLESIDRRQAERFSSESNAKYGYDTKPEDYLAAGMWEFIPYRVFAWKDFPNDLTRWELAG